MGEILNQFNEQAISLETFLLNLLIVVILAYSLSFYYSKFSTSIASRAHISNMLPLVTITTFLVIIVVKSSLALSLGLIGALSIVRFRTPIKEPEELAFIFMGISIGIGLGAEQALLTMIVLTVTLIINTVRLKYFSRKSTEAHMNMAIEIPHGDNEDVAALVKKALNIIDEFGYSNELVRIEYLPDMLSIVLRMDRCNAEISSDIVNNLRLLSKDSTCSVFEVKTMW